jgi:hypothetical protein
MAYDEELAARIRDIIGPDPELTEKMMFGGLAFLIQGNMAISASGQGGVLVRVDPACTGELIVTTKASIAVMHGREMPGWLRVSPEIVATDDDLEYWVDLGVEYARGLPPKTPREARREAVALSQRGKDATRTATRTRADGRGCA